ncbi:NAD(P)H-quinone oxidoreductase subunit 3 chloroplastic [Phtheirospermum japonicum]|uniref:NADH-ubiquinone oxidoreductase chain 3 n=1 Tax=Phtheirospermum japonicum TaxID=374723 RepID=A0A830CX12_9LAMI|nr:NAD(P)H-quinone oxidoreductase subunit 3 chloroplastic [Phtheirospermum japonicum]
MFAIVFVVFDVETIFLYTWAMSFNVLGVSVFIEALEWFMHGQRENWSGLSS